MASRPEKKCKECGGKLYLIANTEIGADGMLYKCYRCAALYDLAEVMGDDF